MEKTYSDKESPFIIQKLTYYPFYDNPNYPKKIAHYPQPHPYYHVIIIQPGHHHQYVHTQFSTVAFLVGLTHPVTGLKLRWTKHLIKCTCFHLLGLQHTANTLYKPMTVHCTVFHRTRKNMKSTIYLNICIHNRILKMELLLLLDASSCHLLIPWFTSEVANVQRSWIRQNIYFMYFISLY